MTQTIQKQISYRTHAVILLSMDLLDPVRAVLMGSHEKSEHLKHRLRRLKETVVFGSETFPADHIVLSDIFNNLSLAQFIDHWYWHKERTNSGLIGEISGVLFPTGIVANTIEEFINDSLKVENLSEAMGSLRSQEHDRQILQAVKLCEPPFLAGDPSDWDTDIISTMFFPNPLLDISFPIYKGYLDLSMISSARLFLRKYFQSSDQLQNWLTQLEQYIGPLPLKKRWEL